jgi:hypothetical protein
MLKKIPNFLSQAKRRNVTINQNFFPSDIHLLCMVNTFSILASLTVELAKLFRRPAGKMPGFPL